MSSFGSPSTMHQQRGSAHPKAASPTTNGGGVGGSAGHVVATSPVLARNENNVLRSSSTPSNSMFQAHGNFVNDHRHHNTIHQNGREVIELTDSDTDSVAAASSFRNKQPKLQAPFDPISRVSTANSSNTTQHRASASPSIASLINNDNIPFKQSKSSNSSPTTKLFPEANGTQPKKTEKHKLEAPDRSPKSKPGTGTHSSAHSPKTRPAAPSKTGNGLLAGVLPGMGPTEAEPAMPTIHLHVPLNGEQNKYINFAKIAEEKYGWAAMNPKLAKAKLGLGLESGDEMMLDSESESNADTAGTAELPAPKKRQRRKYQDIYDKDDPFIDDSEMLWEEQAAASKDGFFVYSGPLVPEGQKPQIERADGTMKRGRGRGRGSRGGASTRGTGATARKPRLTKKEKEKLEKEKEERERFSLMAAQVGKTLNPRP